MVKFTCKEPIFSTYVEVFLESPDFDGEGQNFLHVCGGVSAKYLDEDVERAFSPRMWRCFFDCVSHSI